MFLFQCNLPSRVNPANTTLLHTYCLRILRNHDIRARCTFFYDGKGELKAVCNGNELQTNHNILMSWPDDIQLNLADRAISDRPCHFLHSVALTLSYWNRAISMNELIIPRELVSSSITAESQSMSLRNTCLSLARVQKKQTAIPLALREYPSVEWWHRNGVEF